MNWGWKLAIGSALFMGMIIYFVVQSFQNETHLVSKDYYEQELNFQDKLNATQNAKNLEEDIVVTQDNAQIVVSYPSAIELAANATGSLHFYNVANGHADKKIACDFTEQYQYINTKNLDPGRYLIKVDITANGKNFYFEKGINAK